MRESGNGQTALISVIDARTGGVLRALPNGVLTADRSTLYRTELVNGASQTRIIAVDVASGRDGRAFTIDGAFSTLPSGDPRSPSTSGRQLVLARNTIKLGDQWVTGFAVVNATAGTVAGQVEFKSTSPYAYMGVSLDGKALFVQEFSDGGSRLRVWDFASAAFLPGSTIGTQWDGLQRGFVTPTLATGDGLALVWLDAGDGSHAAAVRRLDLATKRVTTIALPDAQHSDDFEKYLLWSLAISRDASTVYAANPALGFVDEVSLRTDSLIRTNRINVTRAADDLLAAGVRAFFPVADAKRYMRGGALLSADGVTLYAAGTKGIAVIDTKSLSSRATWAGDTSFDSLSISPDGARMYAISDQLAKIRVLRTSDGAVLGEIKPASYPSEVIRIDRAIDPYAVSNAAAIQACGAYAAPDPTVSAEIQHLKTSATVVEILGPCTLRVRIEGGSGTLAPFTGKTIALRATSQTTFATAQQGDLTAIGRFGLKPGDGFTLSFDSRAYPDGSYHLNFMNR